VIARLLLAVLRVLAALFLIRVLLRFLASVFRPQPPLSRATPARAGGELVRDRVCNTFLPRDRAVTALVGGHEEHFCSAECRDRAIAASGR
jgi:hypothetical protein